MAAGASGGSLTSDLLFVQLVPASGGICELESDKRNTASSRSFPFLSLSVYSLSQAVSCSISKTGRQFSIAKQRRQSGSVERYSDLLIQRKG